jgi:hypothetical protein
MAKTNHGTILEKQTVLIVQQFCCLGFSRRSILGNLK